MTYTVSTVADMEALTATAGDICHVTGNTSWYTYDGAAWVFWYKERASLAFQGITFETEVQPPDLLFFGIV